MRDYGKVYTAFWTSDDTRSLSDDGKVLALYLLTGPHTNIIGCFRLPDAYVCEDLDWHQERVSKGFAELFQKGFATRHEKSRWLVIHKFLRWNQIENPNQAKAAKKAAEAVPDSSGVIGLLASALREFCRFSEGWIDAEIGTQQGGNSEPLANPSERVAQTVSKPETGTEQEQKQEPIRSGVRASRLPADWTLPDDWSADAVEIGLPPGAIPSEADKFRDYWTAKAGKDATKLDWRATWRNWSRTAVQRVANPRHPPPRSKHDLTGLNYTQEVRADGTF